MTVQTAFRFTPELVSRLKNRARKEHKSVNRFVEEVLERELAKGSEYGDLLVNLAEIRVPSTIPERIIRMSGVVDIDSLDLDDRAEYILGKGL